MIGRLSFIILILALIAAPAQSANQIQSQHCDQILDFKHIDLAEGQPIRPASITQILNLRQGGRTIHATFIPNLKGLVRTGIRISRSGKPIGELGRLKSGEGVLLRLSQNLQYEAIMLDQLAAEGASVQVLGLFQSHGLEFLVQPLVYGFNPFINWWKRPPQITSRHVDSFFSTQKSIQQKLPVWNSLSLVPDQAWVQPELRKQYPVTDEFVPDLLQFLAQDSFVATFDGRILLESFSTDFKGYSAKTILLKFKPETRFIFDRWSWHRFALFGNLSSQAVIDHFEKRLKENKAVEEMVSSTIMLRSFYGTTLPVLNNIVNDGAQVEMRNDEADPYPTPSDLRFKNNSKLNYHFKKHGAALGSQDENDYLNSAKRFVMDKSVKQRTYYIRSNGDYVVVSANFDLIAVFSADGVLRSYFKPEPVEHGHSQNLFYFFEDILKSAGEL